MEGRRYSSWSNSLDRGEARRFATVVALLALMVLAAFFQPGCGSREISDKKRPGEAQEEPAASQAAPVETSETEPGAAPAPEHREYPEYSRPEITPAPAPTQSETVPESAPAPEQKPQPEDDPCPT